MTKAENAFLRFSSRIRERFHGREEPATVEDVANIYAALITMHDNLLTLTTISLHRDRIPSEQVIELRNGMRDMINNLADDLERLSRRAPEEDANG